MSEIVKAEPPETSQDERPPEISNAEPHPDWMRFRGVLSGEDGEAFARAIEEAFPIER